MSKFTINIKLVNSDTLIIDWPQKISEEILDDIIWTTSILKKEYQGQILNYTPSYSSLLIQFKNVDEKSLEKEKQKILTLYASTINVHNALEINEWHIPVCYSKKHGTDLAVFNAMGISTAEVAKRHSKNTYRVYMIGFLPGFVYLGGLDNSLFLDRKESPRTRIPKGSIAIGGEQTGIYPNESPGGWNIIGCTPLDIFNLEKVNPTPFKQGDMVQFYPIDEETFEKIKTL